MEDSLSFDELALIAGGHTAFQLLWAGVKLGVFDTLSKTPNLSRADIARAIGIDSQPARILLIGLVSLKLVLKHSDSYRNSHIVDKLLVSSSPDNLADVLGWQNYIVYPGEVDFVAALRQHTNVGLQRFPGEEDNLYARLAHDAKLEKVFHDAMSSLSRSANETLVREVDFGDIRHLVDAGGGDGTNAITLARANPHLQVTVFDAPTVCERALANFERSGLSDRLNIHPGNFFITDFPPGIDSILFAHMLTIWSPEKNTTLLKRAYEALPAGGQVFIFNMMGNDDETGPITAALGSPYFLCIATGEGMLYPVSDFERFLRDAGFTQTRRLSLPRDHIVLVGTK